MVNNFQDGNFSLELDVKNNNSKICTREIEITLFEKNNEKSLYEKIIWMFENKEKMTLLGNNARSFAKKNLNMSKRVNHFIKYYNSL